jgi:hypothetical protein
MPENYKYALAAAAVLVVLYYFYRRGKSLDAAKTAASTVWRAAETWPPQRPLEATPATGRAAAAVTHAPVATTHAPTRPPLIGVGAESPTYIAAIDSKPAITDGIRDAAFDEVASTLISANRVVDERIAPVISAKNGGLLPNLDVRGDYAALMCKDEERADDCGCWNRSSAQRGIKLGYITDTDRRRVVLAGP